MAFDYKSWLRTAQDRLDQLKETRKDIQEEISKLEAGIKAFSPLVEESTPLATEIGLTEAIRQIFIESNRSLLAPTGIRDELLRRGFLLEQKNPLAAIHQILARLVEGNFAERVPFQGATYYRWNGMMKISDLMTTSFSERLASQFEAMANPPERVTKERGGGKRGGSISDLMTGIATPVSPPRSAKKKS